METLSHDVLMLIVAHLDTTSAVRLGMTCRAILGINIHGLRHMVVCIDDSTYTHRQDTCP
jgi:hypothetical protein